MNAPPRRVLSDLRETLCAAVAAKTPLRIIGGDTKQAWWRTQATTPLNFGTLRGISAYEPTELVITAYAGTPLLEIEQALAERNQMLGFEPPHTGSRSTIGGVVAAGLAGPNRPYQGAVRDFVLGVRLLSTERDPLRFGGQVMKNVAGYDVARLVTGAWGRLGAITEISLRVIPRPEATMSIAWRCDVAEAQRRMLELGRRALPITGMSFDGVQLRLRLAGSAQALAAARSALPGAVDELPSVWIPWRDLTHPFLSHASALWRITVPPATKLPGYDEHALWDWGGGLRWIDLGARSGASLASLVTAAGGIAKTWPNHAQASPTAALSALEARVMRAFDHENLFNPI
jgi:glycolate oxidase FAD binding subunit